ncbi:BTAD domain-containing putative transcriptional regulator [Nocardiopsis alba]|uniref:BTAD domain-containing putative transcriptional regulator n=1 Tax=Nocardiopsis alba TaxID=53437 RepID=UPI003663659A
MRFGILGPLQVRASDGRVVRVPEAKVRTLLAVLLVHQGTPVPTDRLIDILWGDHLPANPSGVLRSKVSQLRRVLRQADPGCPDPVVFRPPGYLLRASPDALDAERFQALLTRARASEDLRTRATFLADALALWRGPALVDFADETFAGAEIARLEEHRATALEEQTEVRLDLGEHGLLMGELADLVERYPLRERLRGAWMLALYRSGRQGEALERHREFRDRLAEELGVDPGPDLVALHQAILEQDPSLAFGTSSQGPAARPPSNLPAPLTELIGRDDDVLRARRLLDEARLVTLTGAGGVGKTRLACEVAAQVTEGFGGGVWLVELASVERSYRQDRRPFDLSVTEAVAEVLGVRDESAGPGAVPVMGGTPLVERVSGALSGKEVLLVLDNCEHVVDAAAALSETLLGSVPGLRVLATGRRPLGIPGERLQEVRPLETPPASAGPSASYRSSAVRLFAARAAATAHGFALDDGNAATVAAICRRLDGIPLALELAATRVRALGVHELAARLDDRFGLLSSGRRNSPERQRTLQAMIDWSWELLTEDERAVLRRLSVHAGGCTLAAAEEVCAGDGVDGTDVADLLTRLVDRSLVVVVDTGDTPRYRLLESVSAYCADRLGEAGEDLSTQRRFDLHYVALAERADPHLRGHGQRRWLRRMDDEVVNLRAALESTLRRDEAHLALRLVCAMSWYWVLRGRLGEGGRALARALALEGVVPDGLRDLARVWWAAVSALSGDDVDTDGILPSRSEAVRRARDEERYPVASTRAEWLLGSAMPESPRGFEEESPVDRSLGTFRLLGDRWGVAAALSTRAWDALLHSDFTTVRCEAERSMELFRGLGDGWGLLQATDALAVLAQITGDYDRAEHLHRDGLRIAEELGLRTEVSYKLSGLGRVSLLNGDFEQADEFHRGAMRLASDQASRALEQFAELGLGIGARKQGRLDEAEAHLGRWLEWNRQGRWDAGVALVLSELGFVAELRGDGSRSRELHARGYEAAHATRDPRAVALALEGLAGASALAERYEHAARLLGAADTARRSVGAPLPAGERGDVDRIASRVCAVLGEDRFRTERARVIGTDLRSVLGTVLPR